MLRDEIIAEEGVVPHLYLDTRGNVTCGCGMLISKIGELGRFTWTDFTAALNDWSKLQSMKRACEYGKTAPASRYAPVTRARMQDPMQGLDDLLASLDGALGRRIHGFESWPTCAQEALVDMAWNLGVDGLVKGYPKMLAACAAGDWSTAAAECHRNGISDARNQRTYDRIVSGNTVVGSRPGRGA